MSINYDYDLIIIGAGCAGLSLAHRLTGEDYKVCILELSNNINSKNKLWSFWDTYETPYKEIIKKKWVNLIIKDKNKTSEINCDRYSYNSIDSHDFNNYIFKVIKKNKNIDLILSSEVLNIRKEEKSISVATNKNKYICRHVFDSRPENITVSMWQQFFGCYIKTEQEIFDDQKATFMEFSKLRNKFHFMYILPFSPTEALIESTYFSSKKENNMLDEEIIKKYMQNNFPNSEFKIMKSEHGSIPMDTKIKAGSQKYITKIGSYSGATRASTGYTFINIQKQVDHIIQLLPRILMGKNTPKNNFHSYLLRKMDQVFLDIVDNDPDFMKGALIKLFSSKNHDAQIRFLSDTPNIFDLIKVIFLLPKIKFLKYSLGFMRKND